MNNTIGFDLDGVVFNPPVPFYGWIKNIDFNFNIIPAFPLSFLMVENVVKEFKKETKRTMAEIV
ncbi:MAG: hypothetical protein U9P63_01900 [Patescibacteria group bacterium]|nr:hypothetical protein [Patescibacteria group bacterium]